MCAPGDQRKSSTSQCEQAELNALRCQRRADVSSQLLRVLFVERALWKSVGRLNRNDCCGNGLPSVRSVQLPRNCGRRLATKAAIPSFASLLREVAIIDSFSASS